MPPARAQCGFQRNVNENVKRHQLSRCQQRKPDVTTPALIESRKGQRLVNFVAVKAPVIENHGGDSVPIMGSKCHQQDAPAVRKAATKDGRPGIPVNTFTPGHCRRHVHQRFQVGQE